MCFGGGGGRSADDIYKEMKPEAKPLPSLRTEKADRPEQVLEDVPKMRRGMKRRTLLGGY